MAFLKWSEKMSVGVPALDADHKKMVDLINGLSKTMNEGGSVDEVCQAINALVDYARYHFEMEERLCGSLAIRGSRIIWKRTGK